MANPDPDVDWEAIERSPQFQELIAARRRFALPATTFFLAWYIGFIPAGRLRAGLHGAIGP